jgi:hypothetical protein
VRCEGFNEISWDVDTKLYSENPKEESPNAGGRRLKEKCETEAPRIRD